MIDQLTNKYMLQSKQRKHLAYIIRVIQHVVAVFPLYNSQMPGKIYKQLWPSYDLVKNPAKRTLMIAVVSCIKSCFKP